jgi:hypothetical protein
MFIVKTVTEFFAIRRRNSSIQILNMLEYDVDITRILFVLIADPLIKILSRIRIRL